MAKIIPILLTCIMLTACMPKVAIKEKIVEKEVPIFVIPKPPVVKDRPVLDITKLTDNDKKNLNLEIAALTISLEQLKAYAGDLEAVYNKYKELSNTSTTITELDSKTPGVLSIDKLKEFIDKHLSDKK